MEHAEPPIVIDTGETPPGGSQDDNTSTRPPGTSGPDQPGNNTTPPPSNNTDPSCNANEALCNGVCTSIVDNDANCGDCGVVCDGGRVCMGNACACEVGDFCGGSCVDTTMNSAHCGDCNSPCAGGTACMGGSCVAVGEVDGVLLATNELRAMGADCGSEGTFGPAPPLEGDPNLHLAAQVHADDMVQNDFFSHTGSDGSSFSQRIQRTAFSGQPVGENIAAGNRTAQATVQQWADSDGHCRNMMNPNATKLGVGYAEGATYGYYWVQVFGR